MDWQNNLALLYLAMMYNKNNDYVQTEEENY